MSLELPSVDLKLVLFSFLFVRFHVIDLFHMLNDLFSLYLVVQIIYILGNIFKDASKFAPQIFHVKPFLTRTQPTCIMRQHLNHVIHELTMQTERVPAPKNFTQITTYLFKPFMLSNVIFRHIKYLLFRRDEQPQLS